MRRIQPPVPYNLQNRVTGAIVESDDPLDLSQDMVEVSLPGNVLISAGWFPDSSPNGTYRINVTRGLNYLMEPLFTRQADQAADDVAQLAVRYASQNGYRGTSVSQSSYTDYAPPSARGRLVACA